MSLLSSFMRNQLLNLVESEFLNHSDEMKGIVIKEIEEFASEALAWAEQKADELFNAQNIMQGDENAASEG